MAQNRPSIAAPSWPISLFAWSCHHLFACSFTAPTSPTRLLITIVQNRIFPSFSIGMLPLLHRAPSTYMKSFLGCPCFSSHADHITPARQHVNEHDQLACFSFPMPTSPLHFCNLEPHTTEVAACHVCQSRKAPLPARYQEPRGNASNLQVKGRHLGGYKGEEAIA